MSLEDHTEAWRTAVAAALDGSRQVLTWAEADDLKKAGTLPSRYVLLNVEHRFGAPRHAAGRTPMRGYRLQVLIVGTEWECMWARDRLDGLTDARLSSLSSTPLTHENDTNTDDDDLLSRWTYASPA